MKRKRIGVFSTSFILFLVLLTGCNNLQTAATTGLTNFRNQLSVDTAHSLTKTNVPAGQITSLSLGSPLELYYISVHSIQTYKTLPVSETLYDTHQFIVPILDTLLSPDSVITAEQIELKHGSWKVVNYGGEFMVQSFRTFRKKLGLGGNSPYLVQIPGFSLHFLGYHTGSTYYLVNLNSFAFDSIYPGQPMLQEDVLRQLKPKVDSLHVL